MNPAPKPPKSEPQNFSKLVETLQTLSSLIENQALFTNAEFRLATIIVRRGGHREAVIVSAENWKAWTGLDERSREIALRGLRAKGISVDGRGDRAKLRFSIPEFQKFIETTTRIEKPKMPRKIAKAKPGMYIHPDCVSGCQRLCESGKNCDIVPIDSARAQVSETRSEPMQLGSLDDDAQAPTFDAEDMPSVRNLRTDSAPSRENPKKGEFVGRLDRVQPNGASGQLAPQSSERACSRSAQDAHLWSQTLQTMRSYFLTAGESFLARLLEKIQAKVSDASDQEIAEAIRLGTKKHQNSEMLWLVTIPDAVLNLRSAKVSNNSRKPAAAETAQDQADREEFERWYAANHPHQG